MITVQQITSLVQSAPAAPTNPRDSWPEWTDASVWELGPGLGLAEEPRPTAGLDFAPTRGEDAYWAGFTLQLEDGAAAEPPAHLDAIERAEFLRGQMAGMLARFDREDEDREYQLWLDRLAEERMAEVFAEPGEGWHESERVEAQGCVEARR